MHARLTVIIVAWNHPELLAGSLGAGTRRLSSTTSEPLS